jgi:N-acetylmuramic acid 6-phosphate etherase
MSKNIPITELREDPPYIDDLSTRLALEKMLYSHGEAIQSIKKSMSDIELAVDTIYQTLNKSLNGRIIYVGAGTSIRIGVQDGVELYPTFGWPVSRVDFIIAGGKKALLTPVENAEDKFDVLRDIGDLLVTKNDVVIGLAASGNTFFTYEALKFCKKHGAKTINISNNPNSKISNVADYNIFLNTGKEVVAGSTRLKAGTAQKICLNLISTMVMIKFGKVKKGEMINLIATNKKLKERQLRILNN